jgi:hypothetical protein
LEKLIKIRVEINEIEAKRMRGRINEIKTWFFEKQDSQTAKLTKRKRRHNLIKAGKKKGILQQMSVKFRE